MPNPSLRFCLQRISFLWFGFLLFAFIKPVQAQSSNDTLRIETSAICGMCKTRLESELGFLRGLKSAALNLDSKLLTVVYNSKKLSPAAIRSKISSLGYRADSVAANPKAFEALPACCQAEGMHHP